MNAIAAPMTTTASTTIANAAIAAVSPTDAKDRVPVQHLLCVPPGGLALRRVATSRLLRHLGRKHERQDRGMAL